MGGNGDILVKTLFALAVLVALAGPAAAQSYNPDWGPGGNVRVPPYARQDLARSYYGYGHGRWHRSWLYAARNCRPVRYRAY